MLINLRLIWKNLVYAKHKPWTPLHMKTSLEQKKRSAEYKSSAFVQLEKEASLFF
jgi:hypothetical protein